MLAALGLFDLLTWLVPLVVAFLFWRRVGRFMNTVEARAISIDERLERLEKLATAEPRRKRSSASSSPSAADGMNDRDRALLELAAERDRERAADE